MPGRVIITVESETLKTDPTLEIHHVEVTSADGVWKEVFGSTHEVDVFIKGAEASAALLGAMIGAEDIIRKKRERPVFLARPRNQQ